MARFRSASASIVRMGPACCLFLAALAIDTAHAVVPTRTVALSGQQPPGTSVGVSFALFDEPVIDARGRTAFSAVLSGPAVSGANNHGIWSEGSGSLALVARAGDTPPGLATGVIFEDVDSYNLVNDAGQIAFYAEVAGANVDGTNQEGIWSNRTGTLNLVMREGDAVPGAAAGVKFYNPDFPVIDALGRAMFVSHLSGTGVDMTNEIGVWTESPGTLTLFVRTGTQAPGTSSGVNFRNFYTPALNDAGQVALGAFLVGTGVDPTNDNGIWSDVSGSLALVIREGNPAPGTPANFGAILQPSINNAGRVAFTASLVGTGVTATNDSGVWSQGPGPLTLIAREGGDAPGLDPRYKFSTFDSSILINSAGRIAFTSKLTFNGFDADTSLWSEGLGTLSNIAIWADPAPGSGDGVFFASFDSFAINASGRVAFIATLQGTGVNINDRGIWVQDAAGALQRVVQEGEAMEVAPGDLRTVGGLIFLGFSGGEDGQSTGFNDADQIAFQAAFNDGSHGVFVTIGPDDDGDNVNNAFDNCRSVANADQSDTDADTIGDACDNCPDAANSDQADTDTDGLGDSCEDVSPPPPPGCGACGAGLLPLLPLIALEFLRKRRRLAHLPRAVRPQRGRVL